jgi:hypothetical protein
LQVFWGASPVGPYNLNRSGSPAERLQRVRTALWPLAQLHHAAPMNVCHGAVTTKRICRANI